MNYQSLFLFLNKQNFSCTIRARVVERHTGEIVYETRDANNKKCAIKFAKD